MSAERIGPPAGNRWAERRDKSPAVDPHAEQIRLGEQRYGWRHVKRPWYFSWWNYVQGRGSSYRTPIVSEAYRGLVLDHMRTWRDRAGTKILTIELYRDDDDPHVRAFIEYVQKLGCTVETTRESLWYPEGHLLMLIIRVGKRPIEPEEPKPLPVCGACALSITLRSQRFEFLDRDGEIAATVCYKCANKDLYKSHGAAFPECRVRHSLLDHHPHRWMRGNKVY